MAFTTMAVTTATAAWLIPTATAGGLGLSTAATWFTMHWWFNKQSMGVVRSASVAVGAAAIDEVDDAPQAEISLPAQPHSEPTISSRFASQRSYKGYAQGKAVLHPKLPPLPSRRGGVDMGLFRREMVAITKLKFPRAERTVAMKQVVARFVAAEMKVQRPNLRAIDMVKHLDWIVEVSFLPSAEYIEAMDLYGSQQVWDRYDLAAAPRYRTNVFARPNSWWNPLKFMLRGVPVAMDG